MRKLIVACWLLIGIGYTSCKQQANEHLISDENYRSAVLEQFEKRKILAANRDSILFKVFERPLTTAQSEALKFLYAYMPLSDLADYDGDFFLEQVDGALKARQTFEWCRALPEDVFLHFVLPYRVNNENLDHARTFFFNELKNRLKGLSDEEAALEVNHWCHEKVCYRGSDMRTSAPLATLTTSWGRCGEESTFTVAAMRSVGIPARQVYTPRWAHQDDNHAWVEVYVGGRWQYLGACEPEARLNVGWFDVPAKRAMMIHTKAFGKYNGNEEVITSTPLYSELNVLNAYTDTKRIYVKVTNEQNRPLANIKVRFQLYNYAEFYSIATVSTDENGYASLQTGMGNLCVWASDNNCYAYKVISVPQTDTLNLTISPSNVYNTYYAEEYELNVPGEQNVALLPSELIKANSIRLAYEDSVRNAYMQTFMPEKEARELARKLNLNEDKVADIIHKSYGNHKEIVKFISIYATHPMALPLLEAISEKDLRDTKADILKEHLTYTSPHPELSMQVFKEGILSPRIRNEELRAWRYTFQNSFSYSFKKTARQDISFLVDWVNSKITIDTINNYYNCPLTPSGVHTLQVADPVSRNIYFVALCRSFDIPARINQASDKVEYFTEGEWKTVLFNSIQKEAPKAALVLTNPSDNELTPQYYIHYTLQKLVNGVYVTYDYEGDEQMTRFPVTLSLEPGQYALMTGHRYNDGSIRSKRTFFTLKEGETQTLPIEILPLKIRKEVLGKIDMQMQITQTDGSTHTLQELAKGKGVVVAMIDPANEPTRHIMVDIPAVADRFNEWNGLLLFAIPDDKITQAFDQSAYKGLPTKSFFAIDKDRILLKRILKSCGKSDEILPTVVFITEKGEVVFISQGYRIGIGENLLKTTPFNHED